MTLICVGNLTIIGPDNGLSPVRRKAIIWTNAGILLIWPWGTNFNEILIGIHTFSFKKINLNMSSAKWRPFCLGLNVLSHYSLNKLRILYRGYTWLTREFVKSCLRQTCALLLHDSRFPHHLSGDCTNILGNTWAYSSTFMDICLCITTKCNYYDSEPYLVISHSRSWWACLDIEHVHCWTKKGQGEVHAWLVLLESFAPLILHFSGILQCWGCSRYD